MLRFSRLRFNFSACPPSCIIPVVTSARTRSWMYILCCYPFIQSCFIPNDTFYKRWRSMKDKTWLFLCHRKTWTNFFCRMCVCVFVSESFQFRRLQYLCHSLFQSYKSLFPFSVVYWTENTNTRLEIMFQVWFVFFSYISMFISYKCALSLCYCTL